MDMRHVDLVPWGMKHLVARGYDVVITPYAQTYYAGCGSVIEVPQLGVGFDGAVSLANSVEVLSLEEVDRMTRLGDSIRRRIFRSLPSSGGTTHVILGSRPILAEIAHSWCSFTRSSLGVAFLNLPFSDLPVRLTFESYQSRKPVEMSFDPWK
ncbi:MAG: hypothetical protein WC640_01680 [Candidatus Paceibacterota bacterium]|jgi:hypothetical protein